MQLNMRYFLGLGLAVCLTTGCAVAGETGQHFISRNQAAAMVRANSVIISDIGWMRRTPKMIDQADWDKSSKTLSPPDAAALGQWLAASPRLDKAPDPSQCQFAPGFQIRFLDEKRATLETLLICLNCNVLAIGDTSANASGPSNRYRVDMVLARYGDALSRRADLLALVARYFPIH